MKVRHRSAPALWVQQLVTSAPCVLTDAAVSRLVRETTQSLCPYTQGASQTNFCVGSAFSGMVTVLTVVSRCSSNRS